MGALAQRLAHAGTGLDCALQRGGAAVTIVSVSHRGVCQEAAHCQHSPGHGVGGVCSPVGREGGASAEKGVCLLRPQLWCRVVGSVAVVGSRSDRLEGGLAKRREDDCCHRDQRCASVGRDLALGLLQRLPVVFGLPSSNPGRATRHCSKARATSVSRVNEVVDSGNEGGCARAQLHRQRSWQFHKLAPRRKRPHEQRRSGV
mmetsp:Transcript_11568/g.44908  ORF Transcript_11568/g.44908 Transcript_11568/m.44908 type:complete len:202 (-) Transcript_11568:376-981(-)